MGSSRQDTDGSFLVRPATHADKDELTKLIHDSARGLSRTEYTEEQIEALIEGVFGVDSALIDDGTYYTAVDSATGRYMACGGWSRRKTLFGGDQYVGRDDLYTCPQKGDPAKIRAMFVHPDFARRGVGTAILETCETAAANHGYTNLELMSTMPGVKFYERHGYEATHQVVHKFVGVDVELAPMVKCVAAPQEKKGPAGSDL